MNLMLDLVKHGLKDYHPQYGKLLGKDKVGFELYEQLFDSQRVLTSIKDGKVFKQVSIKPNSSGLVTTDVRNFVTGDTLKVKKSNLSYSLTRQNGKTGSWEQIDAMYGGFKPTGDIRDIQFQYINCDIPNSQVFTMDKSCYSGVSDIHFSAAQKNLSTGETVDYVLSNGSVIPKGEHCVRGVNSTQPLVSGSEIDSNLGDVLARNIIEFVKRMLGIKF